MKRIKWILIIVALMLAVFMLVNSGIGQAEPPTIRIAMAQTPESSSADYICDGVDDDVQWQLALDEHPAKIEDLCGTTYYFSNPVTLSAGDITISGTGAGTYFENDGATVIFDAASYSRVLFQNIRTDGGNITHNTDNDSYLQNVWIDNTYYFEGPEGGAGGNTTDHGDLTGLSDDDHTQYILHTEYDSIGEIEAGTGVNIIINTEINSEAELEALLADVTNLLTNNDVIPESYLDVDNAPTDEYSLTWEADTNKLHWQLISGGGGAGCSYTIVSLQADSGSDFTSSSCNGVIAIIGGNDISTVSDGAGNLTINADSTLTRDEEWNTIGEIETATSVNIIIAGEIDTEAELETLLTDVSNLLTAVELNSEAKLEALIGDAVVVDGEIDSEAELEAMLTDVTNVFTNNDTIPEGNIHADITRDSEWDTEGEVETAWGSVNIIIEGEIDSEAEWEALLGAINVIIATEIDSEAELEAIVGIDFAKMSDITGVSDYWWTIDNPSGDDLEPSGNSTLAFWAGNLIEITGYSGNSTIKVEFTGNTSDDDVTLDDVKTACSDDFHNIGGTDDDVPEAGDFDAANDLDANGDVTDDSHNHTGATISGLDISDDTNLTAGDALTLTDDEIDFDGGASPGGELGGTWANPTVDSGIHDDEYIELSDAFVGDVTGTYDATVVGDNSHNHDTTTISGLDLSDDLNATGGVGIDITDDDFTFDATEIGNLTWWNGTGDWFDWIFSIVGTSPVLRAGNGYLDLITGELRENGYAVYTTEDGNLESTTAGDYLTLTGADIDHDPVLRFMPEIFFCSMSGNDSTSVGDCEAVDFNGMDLHVVKFTAGDIMYFHILTPADFGFGGNTTITATYGIRTQDGSSGSALVMATKVATSISDYHTEDWHNSSNLAWAQIDELHWTADLVIDESLSQGEQDLYIGVKLVSEDWDATNIYPDKAVFKAWGV